MSSLRQSYAPAASGLVCIDKPEGCTSFDVVRRVRSRLGVRRVGHAGTLDPLATGVIVVLVGKAAKLQPLVMEGAKEYVGRFRLGLVTDTDDITGSVLKVHEHTFDAESDEFRRRVDEAARRFIGRIDQVPPQFSAVKVGGVRAYARAREGERTELSSRAVEIFEFELEPVSANELSYRVHCSKGTYVRSLARDLGEMLGVGACVSSIRRTRVGDFAVEDAVPLADLEDPRREALVSLESFARRFPSFAATASELQALELGDQRPLARACAVLPASEGRGEIAQIVDETGRFYGLLRAAESGVWNLWFLA